MKRNDLYRYIGYTAKRISCVMKNRYSSREDAAAAAREYNHTYICEGMSEYPCNRHGCWHIGHNDKYREADAKILECIRWFESWNRGN